MSDRADQIAAHVELLWAGAWEGYTIAAHGMPYVAEGGKVRHKDFTERPFAIPRETDALVAYLLDASAERDTWWTPGLSWNPLRDMRRRRSLPSWYLWADLDGATRAQLARAEKLVARGGFLVHSGRGPGHVHVYVQLAQLAPPEQLSSLNRRLVAYLSADASPSALNGYLRPVGSYNFKPLVLSGAPPALVEFGTLATRSTETP